MIISDIAKGILSPIKDVIVSFNDKKIRLEEIPLKLEQGIIDSEKNYQEYEVKIQSELTERLKADMSSDSWLSKNIRPLSLIFNTFLFALLSILEGCGVVKIPDVYVHSLAALLLSQYGFYFYGRTSEKRATILSRGK